MTPALSIIPVATIWLMSTIWSHSAQVVPGVKMVTASSLTLPVSPTTFKQTVLTWDNPLGASNRVAWGGDHSRMEKVFDVVKHTVVHGRESRDMVMTK